MRALPARLLAVSLSAALVCPAGSSAQAPPAAPGPRGGAGSWLGWAKLANDWPALACRYDGTEGATSVRLELSADGALLNGSVAIDLAPEKDSGCPPLRKRYSIGEVTEGPETLSFTDSGGNEWTLGVREGGAALQGMLAWRQGGPEEPLAEGFATAGGVRPGSRLSGEVSLRRAGEGAAEATPGAASTGPGAETPAPPPRPVGAGGHLKNVGIVVGANLVGLGLLYGVNELGKGSSASGVVTCSPRTCVVGPTINDPCFCEGNVVSGASCGTTGSGAAENAQCSVPSVPCQSGLSCNSGYCQDRDGRCPY